MDNPSVEILTLFLTLLPWIFSSFASIDNMCIPFLWRINHILLGNSNRGSGPFYPPPLVSHSNFALSWSPKMSFSPSLTPTGFTSNGRRGSVYTNSVTPPPHPFCIYLSSLSLWRFTSKGREEEVVATHNTAPHHFWIHQCNMIGFGNIHRALQRHNALGD